MSSNNACLVLQYSIPLMLLESRSVCKWSAPFSWGSSTDLSKWHVLENYNGVYHLEGLKSSLDALLINAKSFNSTIKQFTFNFV